jgi:hypothetical protein
VARTIADLHDRPDIGAGDVLEAVRLRSFGPESLAEG